MRIQHFVSLLSIGQIVGSTPAVQNSFCQALTQVKGSVCIKDFCSLGSAGMSIYSCSVEEIAKAAAVFDRNMSYLRERCKLNEYPELGGDYERYLSDQGDDPFAFHGQILP